jgi:DDE superfamily endonuclease
MGGGPLLVPVHIDVMRAAKSREEVEMYTDFNDEMSEARVLVEDVFSWLKHRARILEVRFPRQRKKQSDVFVATCCVYNYIRMRRMEYAHESKDSDDSDSCMTDTQ